MESQGMALSLSTQHQPDSFLEKQAQQRKHLRCTSLCLGPSVSNALVALASGYCLQRR